MGLRIFVSRAALAVGMMASAQGIAQAQDAPASTPQAAPQDATDQGGLPDIIVTAQKRSENLQNVPISISAVTAETAKLAGVSGTLDIGAVTPGLTISKTANIPLLFLRGVGTALGTPGDEGSVSLVVDGVTYVSLTGSVFSLNNIERVEVLRGPQGTLFGRNAAGGVISIITRDPQQEPSVDMSAGFGNYKAVSTSFYATGGLAPGLAADLAVQYNNQIDGFGTNVLNGRDVNRTKDFSIRSKILWQPGDTTTIRLAGDYSTAGGDLGVPHALIPGAVGATGQTAQPDFYDVKIDFQPALRLRAYGGSATVDQELGFAGLRSITAYRNTKSGFKVDQDGEAIPLVNGDFNTFENQFTQELQLSSLPTSSIKWILGGFYLHADAKLYPLILSGIPFGPLGGSQSRFGKVGTRSLAAYGQVTVPVTDTTNITGGLRYTSDKRTFDFFQTTPNGLGNVAPIAREATYNRLTWRASIDQKISGGILGYLSVSRGFKAGSFNVLDPANPPIRPETLTSYEAGLKMDVFDRHLRFNVAGFYYDYKNIQVSQIVAGTTRILNAAKGEIYGADVDFLAAPFTNFTLSGGAEVLHARYKSFPGAPANVPAPGICTPAGPVTTPGPRTGGNIATCPVDASGRQLVRAPDLTLSLTASYVIPTSSGKFGISGTYLHSSSFPWEPDGRLRQRSTDIVNGQVSWTTSDEALTARLWVKNLTDVQYTLAQSSSLNDTYEAAPPRTYGVTLETHF